MTVSATEAAARSERHDMHAPDSIMVRASGDILSWLISGRTFLMQVAHPAVGAGVWEHSTFRQDPWRRLREIDRSGQNFVLRGKDASLKEAARLRRMHRNIAGVDSRGRAYHALDPQVYGWVHTVFLDSVVSMHALYGTPLTRVQQEQLFVEWREAGLIFGLEERDLPATLDGYWKYYEHMIETELEYNPAVDYLFKNGTPPKPPLFHHLPGWLWKLVWKPVGAATRKLTLGSLPPGYRRKIAAHQPWTEADERKVERFRRLIRAVVPFVPDRIRYSALSRRAMCPV